MKIKTFCVPIKCLVGVKSKVYAFSREDNHESKKASIKELISK